MIRFWHCALSAALALSCTFSCTIAKPPKPGHVPPPLLPPCGFFSPPPSATLPFSNVTFPIDHNTRNLTLFNLPLLASQSLSFTFTFASSAKDDGGAPSLAFLLVKSPPPPPPPLPPPLAPPPPPSPIESMELTFTCLKEQDQYCISQKLPLHVCDPLPQQIIQAPIACFSEPDPYGSARYRLEEKVSSVYDAATSEFHLQAVFYRNGLKVNQTFTLSGTHPLLQDSTLSNNESATLFVGYITSGEAIVNVTSEGLPIISSAPSPNFTIPILGLDEDAKSNHKKVVVWPVILGISVLGVMILVLVVTKHHDKRSSQARDAGLNPAPRGALFSHQNVETSAISIREGPPLSPSSTDASQISGTTSWVNQPNPR